MRLTSGHGTMTTSNKLILFKYYKKKQDTKKKPFWKKPLLITKKTIEQNLNDKDIQWVTLDLYNPYENLDGSNKN